MRRRRMRALDRLEVDRAGPRRHGPPLSAAASPSNYAGGPVGVETMAAALGEQRDVLEEVVEPYLIQQGMLQRTPRGRMLTDGGFRYLGLQRPADAGAPA